MRIAYLGIDLLQSALHAALDAGCDVLKIYTCETDNVTEFNTGVCEAAVQLGIPLSKARITADDLLWLKRQGCELLLCAGYYYRVPVCDFFPMVNVHPAPLPSCRGAWPMPLILLGAHPCGGVTLHKIAQDFDTGDILLQQDFPLRPEDTLADYMKRVDALLPDMIRNLIPNLPALWEAAKPQGEGRYLANPDARCWTVDETMTAVQADCILRAFYGYECLYRRGAQVYELIEARARQGAVSPLFPLLDGAIEAQRFRRLEV